MTINQALSHQEQMEAHRRDFADYWASIEPSLAHLSPRAKAMLQLTTWQEWLAERTSNTAHEVR